MGTSFEEDIERDQQEFSELVNRYFSDMYSHGMDPNEACAMSLRVAAGLCKFGWLMKSSAASLFWTTEPPVYVDLLMSSLKRAAAAVATAAAASAAAIEHKTHGHACAAGELQEAAATQLECAVVVASSFFSNPDALFAAFWLPRANVVIDLTSESPSASRNSPHHTDAGTSSSEGGSSAAHTTQGSSSIAPKTTSAAAAAAAAAEAEAATAAGAAATASAASGGSRWTTPSLASPRVTGGSGSSSASHHAGGSSGSSGSGTTTSAHTAPVTATTVAADIDMGAIHALYRAISSLKHQPLLDAVAMSTDQMLGVLARTACAGGKGMADLESRDPACPGLCRQLAIVFANPMLEEPEYHSVTAMLLSTLTRLSDANKARVVDMLATYSPQDVHRFIAMLQQYITLTLYQQQSITPGVEAATQVLGMADRANNRSGAVPFSEFYNDAVNNEDFNIKEDFRRWKAPRYSFSFCKFPFVYDPASKARILQIENQISQFNQLHSAVFNRLFSPDGDGDMCPYLILNVRRGPYLIQDTLIQINRAKDGNALKKALKVKFVGEEGVDEGGVQKEFFQLLVRQLFNPDYGMFTYDDVTRLNWFRPSRIEMDTEFELVGIMIGLAIYNSHILDFSFPMVLYKKLMGIPTVLEDLGELQPEVAKSLRAVLEFKGDVENDFGLSFQVEQESGFGETESVDLIAGGGDVTVTNENREEYVKLHVQHLLDGSIGPQFEQFNKGFLRLCSGAALAWFRPAELELLVCGSRHLDLDALQGATLYDDGYDADSEPVRWFWEVVLAFSEAKKKRLLFFVTGSDRVPIKGLAHLNPPFVVSRAGAHSDRLPSAHTCFNHLLLPDYSSKEYLQNRLELAVENAEGFGLC
ncbi:MAG: hypothetical protein WDW36_001235 [Sanguina aurantia]